MFNNFSEPEEFDYSYSPLLHFNSSSNSSCIGNQNEENSLYKSPQPYEIPNERDKENKESKEEEKKEGKKQEKKDKLDFTKFQSSIGLTTNKSLFFEDHLNEGKSNENGKKNGNNNSENSQKTTNLTSKKRKPLDTPEPKKSTKIERLIQTLKKNFSSYLKIEFNNFIQDSLFPKYIKKITIKLPNYKDFTKIAAVQDNYIFLSFTVLKIFCYYTDKNPENKYQKENRINLRKIIDFIESCENKRDFEQIISFLNMNLENAYTKFYESTIFFQFANDETTIERDKIFQKIYGFSLLEKNGFIRMIKLYYKKTQ